MKTFLFILLAFILCVAAYKLGRSKTTHEYRGRLHDYQIETYFDTVWVYCDGRYVGRYTSTDKCPLDSIVMYDRWLTPKK